MDEDSTRGPVGFAGLGNLGLPMAEALLAAGWSLTAYDLDPRRVEALLDQGARPAAAVGELAAARILVLVVPDDAAALDLLDGQDLLHRMTPGSAVVVHSTLLPETARRLADQAAAAGLDYLDAPVSGGDQRARTGSLTLMAGAHEGVLARLKDYTDTVASQVRHVGPPGAGSATKLANQLMMFAALAGVHEALDLAGAYGVAEADVLAATRTSTGDSWSAREWGFFDRVAQAYDAAGTPVANRPWSKDLWEILAAARAVDRTLPLAGLLSQTMAERIEAHKAGPGAPE